MLHSLKHYHVLHERVVLCSVSVADTPSVPKASASRWISWARASSQPASPTGFFETSGCAAGPGTGAHPGSGAGRSYHQLLPGRETLVTGEHPDLTRWRTGLYMWLASNALSPTRFYRLPPGRVVELGTQVSI